MNKFYILQLKDGKMLVFENGMFFVEETGYPLPDCSLPVGNKTLTKQADILKAILGYEPNDIISIMEYALSIEDKISFNDFKFKIQSENIGGNCPDKLHNMAVDILNSDLTFTQVAFKYILPSYLISDSCILPSEEDILEEYSDLIKLPWNFKVNRPNHKFRNNIIMFGGIKYITERHIEFIKDVYAICVRPEEKDHLNYISLISAENGTGAIILSDSITNNVDAEYFYVKATGVDLGDGFIKTNIDGETIDISFECTDSSLKDYYKSKRDFHGIIKRFKLKE